MDVPIDDGHAVDFFVARLGIAGGNRDIIEKTETHRAVPRRVMAGRTYRNESVGGFARDHGVDPHYVAEMAEVGVKGVPLEDLIQARDHGVDASFVRLVRAATAAGSRSTR